MADNRGAPRVYMAKLNEHCQRNNLRLEYPDVALTGPAHDRVFTVAVEIDKRRYSQGKGKTKKEAREHAAALAWEIIQQERQAELAPKAEQQSPPAPTPSQTPLPATSAPEDYISLLDKFAAKNKILVQYGLESKDGPDHKPVFSQSCKINDVVFGVGKGNNKQTAKLHAAKLAYEKLIGQPTSRAEENCTPSDSSTNRSTCNSHGTSEEASVKCRTAASSAETSRQQIPSGESQRGSVQESMNGASDTSDSVVFQNSIGADLNSECKSTADKLANEIGGIHLNEPSSSFLASPKGPAVKPKRLAANFSMQNQKGSRYTVNERFRQEFEDIEPLGTGGYGNVFKAKHKIDNKIYAVKRVKLIEGKEEKTKKEVQALAILVHENIVQYFGCWIGEDIFSTQDSISDSRSGQAGVHNCLFIHMDYCEKGTLADWICQEGGKESYNEDVLIKFQQIVNGVEYIHNKNYIHRDLKPLNIFISRDDKVKIGDFGLVTSELSEQRTQNRGTRLYMAPEQVWRNYGKEVDVFSLGLILFEMLSRFQTTHEKTTEILKAKEGKLPEVFIKKFPGEAGLIKKLLSGEPSKRPTAHDILERLKKKELCRPHTY